MPANLIYLEFNDSFLLVGRLKNQKDKLVLSQNQQFDLSNWEFKNGILYNPSKIYLHIKSFLKENKIKKANTIICLPISSNKQTIKTNLLALQAALCASSSGLQVEKIINTPVTYS